jgi:hypothetical protein
MSLLACLFEGDWIVRRWGDTDIVFFYSNLRFFKTDYEVIPVEILSLWAYSITIFWPKISSIDALWSGSLIIQYS